MTYFLIAQIISVITVVATIIGLFQKEKFKSLLWFTLANIAMLTTYILLGRYLAVILVAGATLRTFVYYIYAAKNLKPNKIVFVVFEVLFISVSMFLWKDYIDLMMLLNLVVLTYTTWQDDMKILRLGYLISGILLFTYDILVGAYVNSISELILIVSSILSIVKYDIKNRIDDIVLDFYSTIAPSYNMELIEKDRYHLIISKDIDDCFNNFAYISKPNDIETCAKEAIKDLKNSNRKPAVYFQSINNENIHYIIELSRRHPLLFHDVWMKLRTGYNTKYKKCLLEGVTFKQVGEKEKEEILKIFTDGFVNVIGDSVYKYEDAYVDKYRRTLKDEYLKAHNITPYMAYYKGKPISLLFIYGHKTNAYLCQITTLMKYRRNGVASALIRYAIDNQRKKGVEDFYLITEKYTYLEAFYMKNNFEEISQGFCLDYSVDRIKELETKQKSPKTASNNKKN